ncbi:Uncharacterised protein [uncultured archaeon]|nr:Uncharacterised protein [uncultured archaeon]
MMVDACTVMFQPGGFLETAIYPAAAIAGIATAAIVAICYMVSQVMSYPRLSMWAKTEALQVVISAVFVILVVQLIQMSCTLDASSLSSVITANPSSTTPLSLSLFNASTYYLENVASYSHAVLATERFYMGRVNIAESYSLWECPLWCFFSQGGSGTSSLPESGKSYLTSGLMVGFNVALFAYLNAMMHIYFLGYINTGFFLFFLPLAIILRALPYMRHVGSLLLSVVFGFFVIYPLILASFSIALPAPTLPTPDESALTPGGGFGSWLSGDVSITTITSDDMFKAMGYASLSFFHSIFILTMALLATAAASAYFGKLMGEEIDLSRIMQMV